MPLTTASQVIEAGSLRWELFEGLTNAAGLRTLVDRWITVADAFVYRRVGAATYGDSDARIQSVLGAATSFLTLAYLGTQAKARKVYGTHYSFDSEDSQSYDNPLETEWRQLAIELLDEFATIDTATTSFAAPVLLTSDPVDLTLADTADQELLDMLDQARGFSNPQISQVVR